MTNEAQRFITREEIEENERCGDSTTLLVEKSLALRLLSERDAYREVAKRRTIVVNIQSMEKVEEEKGRLVDAEAARILEKKS